MFGISKTSVLRQAIAAFALCISICVAASPLSAQTVPAQTAPTQTAPTNDTNAGPEQFAGTWHAKFKGKIFETIVLKNQDGKITGTVSRGEIQLNDNGELTSAEQTEGSDPIIESRIVGKTLFITCKDEDGDSIKAEIKLTADGHAELQMVTPPNVSAPKPWKLERESANKSSSPTARN